MAKIAIVGGGIAGISAAVFLKKTGHEPIVFEKEAELGGCIYSIQKEGYSLECGPNTVLLNTDGFKALVKELDLNETMVLPNIEAAKNRFIIKGARLRKVPTKPQEFVSNSLLSIPQKFRLLLELSISKKESNANESIADFVRRRFGKAFYDNFINPFVTGIYAGDPEQMSVKYALKMLWELEQEYGSVIKGFIKKSKKEGKKAPSKMFQLKGGLKQIFTAFEEQKLAEVHKSTSVVRVKKVEDAYALEINKLGVVSTETFDKVIFTSPSHILSSQIDHPSLSTLLNKINYVPITIMHFGFDQANVGEKIPGFGALTKENEKKSFLGLLFNSRIFKHVAPKGKDLFTAIIGGARSPELGRMDNDSLKALVLKDIKNLMQIEGEEVFYHVWKKDKAIPQYDLNHHQLIKEIEQFEDSNTGLHIMSNFVRGISVGDCVDKMYQLSKRM